MNFLHLSLQTANGLFGLSNVVLILGAVLVLVGTIGAVWTGGIREQYADERISNNEKETAQAKERAAIADRAAAEANLALERIKAPRSFTNEQAQSIGRSLREFQGTPYDMAIQSGDPEAQALGEKLLSVLDHSGWSQTRWTEGDIAMNMPGRPSLGITNVTGLYIQVNPSLTASLGLPATSLQQQLATAGIDAKIEWGLRPSAKNHDAIHILIGRKPY